MKSMWQKPSLQTLDVEHTSWVWEIWKWINGGGHGGKGGGKGGGKDPGNGGFDS